MVFNLNKFDQKVQANTIQKKNALSLTRDTSIRLLSKKLTGSSNNKDR